VFCGIEAGVSVLADAGCELAAKNVLDSFKVTARMSGHVLVRANVSRVRLALRLALSNPILLALNSAAWMRFKASEGS